MTKNIWEPRSVYLYIVCIITLIMAIVAFVQVVRSTVELAYPEPVAANMPAVPPLAELEGTERLAEERLAEERELAQKRTIRYAVLSLVQNLAMLLVSVPVYLYHWRQVRQTTAKAPAQQAAP